MSTIFFLFYPQLQSITFAVQLFGQKGAIGLEDRNASLREQLRALNWLELRREDALLRRQALEEERDRYALELNQTERRRREAESRPYTAGLCDVCGRPLPEDIARQQFYARRQRRLLELHRERQRLERNRDRVEEALKHCESELQALEEDFRRREELLAALGKEK